MSLTMTATKIKKDERTRTGNKTKRELPWNVILHNDWENSMPRVVVILKKVIPGMTLAKATVIMYEAHSTGQALVKSCHRELAEAPTLPEPASPENLVVRNCRAGPVDRLLYLLLNLRNVEVGHAQVHHLS